MTCLDLPEEWLRERGAWLTAREIARQPDCWLEVAALLERERARLEAWLAPLRATPGLRVVLTGAGTSSFVGQCLQPLLLQRTGLRVESIATTELVAAPRAWLQPGVPTLLVSFARSGGSPESLAAVELADACVPGVHHLVITCNAAGGLYAATRARPRTFALALPESTHDQGFAMTASFTSMLLAGLVAFMLPAGVAGTTEVAAAVRAALPAGAAAMRELAGRGHARVVFLGSSHLAALAAEAALKVMELSDGRVATFAHSSLGFRHGPKAIVDAGTLVAQFTSNDPLAARYDLDLLRELATDGAAGALLAIGAGADPRVPGVQWQPVDLPAGADPALLMLPQIVLAQAYALHRSLALGRRPDVPNDTGVVNRVVRGVILHGAG